MLKRQYQHFNKEHKSYQEWASRDITEVFGKKNLDQCYQKEINELRSIYLQNNGDGTFTYKALPPYTQFSPIKGMVTWDINQDGFIDLLAQGNNYNATVDFNSQDAGQGIILLSNGDGSFNYVPHFVSNFYSRQDSRALAILNSNGKIIVLNILIIYKP